MSTNAGGGGSVTRFTLLFDVCVVVGQVSSTGEMSTSLEQKLSAEERHDVMIHKKTIELSAKAIRLKPLRSSSSSLC